MTLVSATSVNAGGVSTPVQILVLLTLITILPGVLFAVTGFTRILIVLGFVRNALGTPTTPPNQILVGIAFFLTLFVMAPTLHKIDAQAVKPYMNHTVSEKVALERAAEPLRTFMFKQTRTSDLALFINLSHGARPRTRADVPTHVLVPAFIISELKTAFQIGFLLFIPFVIIDLVVASVLMSMGMMMLSPVLISLPFKIMLFVLVDGWSLVMTSLAASFMR